MSSTKLLWVDWTALKFPPLDWKQITPNTHTLTLRNHKASFPLWTLFMSFALTDWVFLFDALNQRHSWHLFHLTIQFFLFFLSTVVIYGILLVKGLGLTEFGTFYRIYVKTGYVYLLHTHILHYTHTSNILTHKLRNYSALSLFVNLFRWINSPISIHL